MSPGTVLDGRYRLEVLLSEHGGARFWRATDTVLARAVAVHVVPSDDPRAPAVLDAARRSAGVTDPHFLRVLDCADVDGVTWVINEWGEGVSLDVMLAQGTLPPMRAAWLAREVAEAIAAAHSRDLYHGRLNPEAVLVTESGSVKIIGFVVNAAFERSAPSGSWYGDLSEREADVIDLAGILYAAVTGRWPGVAPSAVQPAPREAGHPLRPRQVRAGVPRTLDAICDRVLHKEASRHVLPIESAYEIAAALSDYVGDPAAVAPVDVPSMHDEPGTGAADAELSDVGLPVVPAGPGTPDDAAAPAEVASRPAGGPAAPVAPAAPAVSDPVAPPPSARPTTPPTSPPPPAESSAPAPTPAQPAAPAAPAAPADPEETMASAPPYSPSGIEYLEPEAWEPAAPPPPFEQPVARPLFASEERRVPASAPLPPTTGGGGSWPFDDQPPARPEARPPKRRHRVRNTLVLLLLLAALAGAAYAAFVVGKDDGDGGPGSATTPTTSSAPPTPVTTGTPVPIVRAGDFDPEGDPPQENPEQVPRAIDQNDSTAWKTSVYRSDPRLGGIKSGVGLVLDLGSSRSVTSVEVKLVGAPTDLELYATPPGIRDAPVELADTRRIGALTADGTSTVFRLDPETRTRFLVVWLTKLPAVSGGFQGQIAEITVRS